MDVHVLGVDLLGVEVEGVEVLGVDELGVEVLGVEVLGVDELGVELLGVDELGVEVLGVDELGVEVLGVDVLGVEVLGVDVPVVSNDIVLCAVLHFTMAVHDSLKHKDSFGKSENLAKTFFTEILVFHLDYECKSSSSNGLL